MFFLHYLVFSKKECSNQKTYLQKFDGSPQKSMGRPILRPHQQRFTIEPKKLGVDPFPDPVSLQVVRYFKRCSVAGGE